MKSGRMSKHPRIPVAFIDSDDGTAAIDLTNDIEGFIKALAFVIDLNQDQQEELAEVISFKVMSKEEFEELPR